MRLTVPTLCLAALVDCISVTTGHGNVIGQTVSGVEKFNGIPYAQPPIGDLRFKPPQPLNAPFGTFICPLIPPACPQTPNDFSSRTNPALMSVPSLQNPFLSQIINETEDCLTIDVVRPINTTADSKLPVLFWIYGGGFMNGATQQYPGEKLVHFSQDMRHPIIFVAPNYRIGALGFLPGKEIKSEGSGNAGLRDQRLALQWVQENIAAFGGDPDKVTIAGESAGSDSVMYQALVNRGNNTYNGKQLFRAAIQSSGALHPLLDIDAPKAQAIYDTLASAAGCNSHADSLACLRMLNTTEIVAASAANPPITSYRGLHTSYRPRPDDSDNFLPLSSDLAFQARAFANVSYINGNMQDEGTFFHQFQTNITSMDELVDYIVTGFPEVTRPMIAGFVDTYSLDPGDGSPYNTGTENQLFPMFKQLSAIAGDYFFFFRRRLQLQLSSPYVKCWSFLMSAYADTPWFGSYHGADLYGLFSNSTREKFTEDSQSTYYINFVYYLNPNGSPNRNKASDKSDRITYWPQYTLETPVMLNYLKGQNEIIPDTFRFDSYEYFKKTLGAWKS